MNLLENDITNILIQNYDISIGHTSSIADMDIHALNEGIVATNTLRANNITHCTIIPEWKESLIYSPNTFWRHQNKIYVLLYSPGSVSVFPPTGSIRSNMILDDNHVWKYICDVDYVASNDYVVPKHITEIVKRGTVSSVNIIKNSNHKLETYTGFYAQNNYLSGQNIVFVVENDQNTFLISDILIQDGGGNYKKDDIFVLTDKNHKVEDAATINLYIENGSVKLADFTNGQNYEYLDILIIGDGEGAQATYTAVAGVLTNVSISNGGTGYTWAKAIILNSERYVIGNINIEPLNGYNSDLIRHIGPNKYIITTTFKLGKEINYYGIHRKKSADNKFVFFDNIYIIDEFVPESDEEVTVKLLLGN